VPEDRCRVTLAHFYERLGKSLREWAHWEKFVDGFHPRLFRQAGVHREEMLANPERLPTFFERLMDIRAERTTSGVTRGQADLIESPAKVKAWHEKTTKQLDEFKETHAPTRKRYNTKLRELFPELRELRL
jgi:hypothetical protein